MSRFRHGNFYIFLGRFNVKIKSLNGREITYQRKTGLAQQSMLGIINVSSEGGTTVSSFLRGNLIYLRGNKLTPMTSSPIVLITHYRMTSYFNQQVMNWFDRLINDVKLYFQLMAVMGGIIV